MRKSFWKKAMSLGLAAVMTFSLAACGKDGEGNGGGNKTDNNSELAKQYVYSYQEIPLESVGDDLNVRDMVYISDRIYAVLNIYNKTQEANKTQIVSFKTDSSDIQTVELQSSISTEEGSNSWMNALAISKDGIVCAAEEVSKNDYSDPENPIFESNTFLVCWNQDGTEKWRKKIEDLRKNDSEYIYINNISFADDGSINMLTTGDKSEWIHFDAEGNLVSRKEMDSSMLENSGSIFIKPDGKVFYTKYNEDWTKISACTYDPETNTTSEEVELPGNVSMYNMYQGTASDIILTNNSGVYTYNIGDQDIKQIMSYINSDLATNNIQNIVMIDDEHFAAAYQEGDSYKVKIGIFTKVDPKDIPDKVTIVLAANYLGSDVRQRIINFNKTNQQYRITLRDYSEYATMEDYMASYTKLNNDIISGNMPDILFVDQQMPIDNYIAKGLIADIGSLIEKDEELSKKEFMENVFDAYKINDKLYYLISSFTVGTVIGKTSVVGDKNGWTMEEMQQLMATMPEGTQSFGDLTRSTFLYYMMMYGGSTFVDQSSGKCNFNSPEFITMLEFAQSLPETIDYDYEDDSFWMGRQSQYRDNKTVLLPTTISQIKEMNYTINGLFGEDVTFIGFPNENSNGSVINVNDAIVLSAKSKNLDGAWEFVRYYLTDEYQTNEDMWSMPVEKNAFMAQAQKALERPYWLNENGEKEEYDETVSINGEEVKLPPMNQEQIDKIVAFVETVNRSSYYNQDITNIIEEETAAFFAGQKTAAEVVQIIQSRAQIFVDENR